MEVHHPHHQKHVKNLKEYFLEFFMLFLAVSLGFLAENIREHYVEKERSHELVASFMKDVELNMQFVDSLLISNKKLMNKCDSVALYIIQTNQNIDLAVVYEMPQHSYRYLSNNDTYEQMKSSGSLRYIKDTILLRKMIEYSNISKATEFRSVTMEYEYTSHEYQNTLNKYIPIEISANKHTRGLFNYGDRFLSDSTDLKMYISTRELIKDKQYILSSDKINQMKKDMVPVIYRRTNLIYSTMNFLFMTKKAGKELLDYYKNRE